MTTMMPRTLAPVKSSRVLFTLSMIRRCPGFGVGVSRPGREKVAPYSLADLDAIRDMLACPDTAPFDGEAYGRFLDDTLSPIQFHSLMEVVGEMYADRDAYADDLRDEDDMLREIAHAYDQEQEAHGSFADQLAACVAEDGPLDRECGTCGGDGTHCPDCCRIGLHGGCEGCREAAECDAEDEARALDHAMRDDDDDERTDATDGIIREPSGRMTDESVARIVALCGLSAASR